MIRIKKMMAASLALVLGTFALAGCTRSETAGLMDNSVTEAQTEETMEDAVSSAAGESEEGDYALSSATGGKGSPGEKRHKGERGTIPDEETAVEETIPDKTFTHEELSRFDSKDGTDAYIAIDSIIFNVTVADGWMDRGRA